MKTQVIDIRKYPDVPVENIIQYWKDRGGREYVLPDEKFPYCGIGKYNRIDTWLASFKDYQEIPLPDEYRLVVGRKYDTRYSGKVKYMGYSGKFWVYASGDGFVKAYHYSTQYIKDQESGHDIILPPVEIEEKLNERDLRLIEFAHRHCHWSSSIVLKAFNQQENEKV